MFYLFFIIDQWEWQHTQPCLVFWFRMSMSEQEVCLLLLLFMECVISYRSLPFHFGILLIDTVSNIIILFISSNSYSICCWNRSLHLHVYNFFESCSFKEQFCFSIVSLVLNCFFKNHECVFFSFLLFYSGQQFCY